MLLDLLSSTVQVALKLTKNKQESSELEGGDELPKVYPRVV